MFETFLPSQALPPERDLQIDSQWQLSLDEAASNDLQASTRDSVLPPLVASKTFSLVPDLLLVESPPALGEERELTLNFEPIDEVNRLQPRTNGSGRRRISSRSCKYNEQNFLDLDPGAVSSGPADSTTFRARPFDLPANKSERESRRYAFATELLILTIIASVGVAKIKDAIGGEGEDKDYERTGAMALVAASDPIITPIGSSTVRPEVRKAEETKTPSWLSKMTRTRVRVSSIDTVPDIAGRFLQDRDLAWLIADLNRDRSKEFWIDGKRVIELQSGQMLELPSPGEIEKFNRERAANTGWKNIITVVAESRLEQDILDLELGALFSAGMVQAH